ncbi:MAG: YqaA family protein, partial [Albidovulum sp.]
MIDFAALGLLFSSGFLSATLLPGSSEVVLVALLTGGRGDPLLLSLVATAGNTLGAVTNWALGRLCGRFRHRRWYPISPTTQAKAEAWFDRYGIWSLLFSWIPVIG